MYTRCLLAATVALTTTASYGKEIEARRIKEKAPVVQFAILLDTSGSMSGLIEQTKSQLWKIVNELASARRNGKRPELQVALYEYGNDGLNKENHWIRRIVPLTTDLDKIAEELFALRTNGGSEYCGAVIDRAVRDLTWTADPNDLKIIYIAGNEPFTQGPVHYRDACKAAISKGIIVNTIHCGDYATGERTSWRDGAVLADGSYSSIDQNKQLVAVKAPQDEEIVRLGVALNETYVPYGAMGKAGQSRQNANDFNATQAASVDSNVQRQAFKCSTQYRCDAWDLVDAVRNKKVKLGELKAEQLPKDLQKLSTDQLQNHLDEKLKERTALQKKIARLTVERNKYVSEQRKKQKDESGVKALDEVVIESLRTQAESKSFVFEAK